MNAHRATSISARSSVKPKGKHKVQESTQAISNDRIALFLTVGYQVTRDELWERTYRAILDESTWNNITKRDISMKYWPTSRHDEAEDFKLVKVSWPKADTLANNFKPQFLLENWPRRLSQADNFKTLANGSAHNNLSRRVEATPSSYSREALSVLPGMTK